jgi:hypothetical protein
LAHPNFCAVGKHRIPEGSRLGGKNSPAFERRGLTVLQTSPAGTIENGACRVAALAKMGFVSAVPAGLDVFLNYPSIVPSEQNPVSKKMRADAKLAKEICSLSLY